MVIREINTKGPFELGIPAGYRAFDSEPADPVGDLYAGIMLYLKGMEGDSMDSGEGRMVKVDAGADVDELRKRYPKSKGMFEVGEIFKLKGSLFKVARINPFGILLKVQKQD